VTEKFIPFALPDLGEEEIAEVVDSLRSGWITTGPKARRFEQDFAAYLGGDVQCVSVNSATAGLHLALEAIGIGPGDQVIVPTHTFTATAEVVRYLGGDPVFVDIDLDTYCLDPARVEAAITARTRAIMPVHYGGYPCDMPRLQSIAKAHGLRIVEDAAHAFPTLCNGRLVGTLDTDCSVFSFYATKTIATGEGGMLVTRDEAIAHRARVMRLHGIDRDAFDRYTAKKPAWYYEVVAPGYKYNMTDVAASLGIHQLRKADAFQARRTLLASRYFEGLADLPLVLPPQPAPGSTHAWHLFVVRLGDAARVSRDEAIERLYEAGIGCSVHYVPLHLQPYWRDRYGLSPEQFPNSQRLFERGFSLPLYTKMSDDDQARVIAALRVLLG
jgi:dTDP-4-amino-4,6-dideoxygalactose transaminase